jgi:aminoglycoside phosphotransferase (APT) family kinase protein
MRMHPDQVDVTTRVVARLVAEQFPQWRDRKIIPVSSHGTVNLLFRMGDEHVLRFPLQPDGTSADELIAEQEHARRVAPHVPLSVPQPVAVGRAGVGYAGPWSVFRWIEGESADRATDYDAVVLAENLAAFVLALRRIGTGRRTWAGSGRADP